MDKAGVREGAVAREHNGCGFSAYGVPMESGACMTNGSTLYPENRDCCMRPGVRVDLNRM